MSAFFTYIRELFEALFRNFVHFLATLFVEPWRLTFSDFKEYNIIFRAYNGQFDVWGWMLFIFFILLILTIIGAFIYLIYALIKRVIVFQNKRVNQLNLIAEVQKLNRELFFAVQEKNEILKLKAESLGLEDPSKKTEKDKLALVTQTFPKLAAVDAAYDGVDTKIVMADIDAKITLEELAIRFRDFAASQLGLYYDLNLVRTLFASLGTTKILILEGISGTGKTSLPYALGKFFKRDVAICSVQPSWRDRTELIGYYNEFTKNFNETEFLRAIYEASYREDNNIIILDEMNLARIEYYFAEMLSIMEMPNPKEWIIEVTKTPKEVNPKNISDGKLLIAQNLWFVGTANNDDSTFTITDKVYDRALSLTLNDRGAAFDVEFTEPVRMPFSYLDNLYNEAQRNHPLSKALIAKFGKLDAFVVEKFRIGFGNRIMRQIRTFVPNFVAAGGSELDALDFMFASKILKKFKSLNLAFLHDELKQLNTEIDKTFGKNTFKQSQQLIQEYISRS